LDGLRAHQRHQKIATIIRSPARQYHLRMEGRQIWRRGTLAEYHKTSEIFRQRARATAT